MIEIAETLVPYLTEIDAPMEAETGDVMRYWVIVENRVDAIRRIEFEFILQPDGSFATGESCTQVWSSPAAEREDSHGWFAADDDLELDWYDEAMSLAAVYALHVNALVIGNISHYTLLNMRLAADHSNRTQHLLLESAALIGSGMSEAQLSSYSYDIAEAERIHTHAANDFARLYGISSGRSAQPEDFEDAYQTGRQMLIDLEKNSRDALKESTRQTPKPNPSLN